MDYGIMVDSSSGSNEDLWMKNYGKVRALIIGLLSKDN